MDSLVDMELEDVEKTMVLYRGAKEKERDTWNAPASTVVEPRESMKNAGLGQTQRCNVRGDLRDGPQVLRGGQSIVRWHQ